MSTITDADVMRVGQVTLNMIGVMAALGHESPSASTVYTGAGGDEMAELVMRAFRSCVPGADKADREALCRFADERGLLDEIAAAVAR